MATIEEMRARKRESMCAYRATHPDYMKRQSLKQRARYAADPEPRRAQAKKNAKARYEADPDKMRAQARACYAANRAKRIADVRIYQAAHADQVRGYKRAWDKSHPEVKRAITRSYRARVKGCGGKHTAQDVRNQYRRQRGKCFWCKTNLGKKYHVDHVIPIARGGTNDKNNIVVACSFCNQSKGAKLPAEFAGRLL